MATTTSWPSDVIDGRRLGAPRVFVVMEPGLADGLRVDVEGNVWTSAGDGIHVLDAQGTEAPADRAARGEQLHLRRPRRAATLHHRDSTFVVGRVGIRGAAPPGSGGGQGAASPPMPTDHIPSTIALGRGHHPRAMRVGGRPGTERGTRTGGGAHGCANQRTCATSSAARSRIAASRRRNPSIQAHASSVGPHKEPRHRPRIQTTRSACSGSRDAPPVLARLLRRGDTGSLHAYVCSSRIG